jgi:GT2 family glycosyltransferase
MLELSIITVNYNGLRDTREFIRSVLSLELPFSHELIVVDNGSDENEAAILLNEFPSILTIRSDSNLGFAGGNNLGIANSSGSYLFLLNNDTLLPEASSEGIGAMISFLHNNPRVGGLSPRLKYTDSKNLIQFAGSTLLSSITLRNRQIGYQQDDKGQHNDIQPIPYLHGAAMMLSRTVVEEVGLIPECYFLYYEEMDWSRQIRQKYMLYYYPDVTVYHKESSTIGIGSPLKAFYMSRSRLLYAYRNRKGLVRLASIAYLLLIAVPLNVFRYIRRGNRKQAIAVIKGAFSFFMIRDKLK